MQYIKTMHALASIQHVHDKIMSTVESQLSLHQIKHFPCCTHAGLLCPIPHSWLMEHIWMLILGGVGSPWLPWSDRRNQISDLKEKYLCKKNAHAKLGGREGGGGKTKGFYLATRWASRNFTFLWGSPVQWPHLKSFSLHDGVVLMMWTRFLLDETKRCTPITSGIQPMGPNQTVHGVDNRSLAPAVSGYRSDPAKLIPH